MSEEKNNGIDLDWVKEQMTVARTRRASGDAVLKLLELWDTLGLTPEQAKEAVDVFKHVSLGHSIVAENPNEVWVSAQPGQLKVADQVRVKHNAYDGELGRVHNGRKASVVGIRYGDIIVRSTDDKEPFLDGAHYSPHVLEVRIK